MDKAIEIVLVVVVLFVTALIVASMVTSEADGFMGFMGDQSDSAKCNLMESKYDDATGAEKAKIGQENHECEWSDYTGGAGGENTGDDPCESDSGVTC